MSNGNELINKYAAWIYGYWSEVLELYTPFWIALIKYGVFNIDVVVCVGNGVIGDLK